MLSVALLSIVMAANTTQLRGFCDIMNVGERIERYIVSHYPSLE